MTMEIRFNEKVVRMIVHAINRATTVDIPMARRDNQRATNNCHPAMGVDVINDNIFKLLTFDGVQVHRFNRHGWKVCMILDSNDKNAYFVLSERNLKGIPKKKGRTWPHYLQTTLHEFHKGYVGRYSQQTLFPMEKFSNDVYEKDLELIIGELIEDLAAWHLYVIAHEHLGDELTSVTQYFLSPDFEIIDQKDLADFIVPDYSAVVKPIDETAPVSAEEENAAGLVKLKPKPRTAAADADPVVKPNEYDSVG